MFVLYDDFGKLALKNIESMLIPNDFIISDNTAQNFSYKTSIDNQTYNRIQLYTDDKETNKREFSVAQDAETIKKWGILQLTEKLNNNENGKSKAETILKLYNLPQRTLTVNDVFGDVRARAGSSVLTTLNLGDIILNGYMLVEKAQHDFENGAYTMSLDLKRSDFNS